MQIGKKQRAGSWTLRCGMGVGVSRTLLIGIVSVIHAVSARAAVIEFFNPDLNNYFITADPAEQDLVDTGAVGRWQRTGSAFATGGPNPVCRFYGSLSPGPNSHFYAADPAECAELKRVQAATPASQKRWNFESNDFLTTPATNGGCPAGLVPVYRAYNNGFARGVDSNHRITSSHAAYLATVAAGSIGEGVVMCAPAGPPPLATAVGVATGSAVNTTIGAAGGSASTPDGRIRLIIPAGALAADTVIGIQPVTNLAHGKIGAAYRLTPVGQTFLKPITIRFAYTDEDLEGTAADFLGAAFQTADGFWQWAGEATVDDTAKTVSVTSTGFGGVAGANRSGIAGAKITSAPTHDWSNVRGIQIRPARKTVKPGESVGLEVMECFPIVIDDELASLANDCERIGQLAIAVLSINEWSVNGVPGGVPDRPGRATVFGTVNGSGATAIYRAPATEPTPNTVAVSARLHVLGRASTARLRYVSNITITDDSWTGTGTSVAHGPFGFYTTTADVTWTRESLIDKVATYVPTGTANLTFTYNNRCTLSINPPSAAIDPSIDGTLTIDYNSDPPTYHGKGESLWAAMFTTTCPEGSFSEPDNAHAFFLGGSAGDGETRGVVSPDGVTIQGSDTAPGSGGSTDYTWKFTRNR